MQFIIEFLIFVLNNLKVIINFKLLILVYFLSSGKWRFLYFWVQKKSMIVQKEISLRGFYWAGPSQRL